MLLIIKFLHSENTKIKHSGKSKKKTFCRLIFRKKNNVLLYMVNRDETFMPHLYIIR